MSNGTNELPANEKAGNDNASVGAGVLFTRLGEAFAFNGKTPVAPTTSSLFDQISDLVTAVTVAKTNSSPYGFSSSDADKVVTFVGSGSTAILELQNKLNGLLTALAAQGFIVPA